MVDLLAIGETMVAFSPSAMGALSYVPSFEKRIVGAESNTAIGLSKLNFKISWVGRLGNDEFGRYTRNQIRAEGVDTSNVIFDDKYRTGIMFKEITSSDTKVYYYRENSAASHMTEEDITEELLKDVKIVHLSGITPVLSENCMKMVKKVYKIAEKMGTKISFDPNIRKKLWGGKDFAPDINEMTLKSHIVMIGLDEAKLLLGTDNQEEIFDILLNDGFAEFVAIKDGARGSWVGTKAERHFIPPFKCNCIDPIGAGDAFNAGLLAGILSGKSVEYTGKMANLLGALATETLGDIEGYPSLEHIENILQDRKEIYR